MIVYKKCRARLKTSSRKITSVVVTLNIPSRAKKVLGAGENDKCRASCADVLDIRFLNNRKMPSHYKAYSIWYGPCFEYKVGQRVKPMSKFDDSDYECASGIHFFRNKKRAEGYCL